MAAVPVELHVFDLLYCGGESLLTLPYTQRRDHLADLGLDSEPARTPPWYRGSAADVLAASVANGLEGVVLICR